MQEFKETNEEVIAKWNRNEIVWSAELGGMGPGYEQAIQILLFELLANWKITDNLEEGEKYSEIFNAYVDSTAHRLSKLGFSGAQVEVARATAFQFLKFGYAEIMNKLPDERRIMVNKSFPSIE